jgi:hypothetical protein
MSDIRLPDVPSLLAIISALLFMIWWHVHSISKRLKERFPTEKELDYELSQTDPMAHYDLHKNDKKK